MVEQAAPCAEQNGRQVDLYLVKQPDLQALLNNIRAACHRDIFVACGGFGLLEGAFDTVGDEGKHRAACLDQLFSGMMRKYKYRPMMGSP